MLWPILNNRIYLVWPAPKHEACNSAAGRLAITCVRNKGRVEQYHVRLLHQSDTEQVKREIIRSLRKAGLEPAPIEDQTWSRGKREKRVISMLELNFVIRANGGKEIPCGLGRRRLMLSQFP